MDKIELYPDFPRKLTVASYGGVGGSQSPMHHGFGGKKAEVDSDVKLFFRVVD